MQSDHVGCRRALAAAAILLLATGCGEHEGPGEITGERIAPAIVEARAEAQSRAGARLAERAETSPPSKRILFGDLHVHTTFSADAFMMSLPFAQGEGARPVADACDYARYCSGLDFWSINDHAESLTPRRWRETVDTIRQCNALAGDPKNPDVVAFLGWEWTQVGWTPQEHYGHKNVIVRDLEEGRVPRRPIHSASYTARAMRQPPPNGKFALFPLLDWPNHQRYLNVREFQKETREVPWCPDDVDTKDLPDDCMEGAATPEVLFRKLDEWGLETMVIPHGTTWGIYTPRGSSWDKQLNTRQHDPQRQRLIEVFSGHGNSEEYRDFSAVNLGAQGAAACPEPVGAYEACCWRAGEIIRSRCDAPDSPQCEQRVLDARRIFLEAGPLAGRVTVPGTTVADWKNCESCPDCFNPAMNYRPKSSVQYILALSSFENPARPNRFELGFIASSDNHRARPGTGFKEVGRQWSTEAVGPPDRTWYERVNVTETRPPAAAAEPYDRDTSSYQAWQTTDFERNASFFLTGGLAAVHSEGRSREQIWDALERREVYGTSGDHILLWFDLLNGPGGEVPMGGKAELAEVPRFRVRAVGAREQLPGCPDEPSSGLPASRLQSLCHGECFNPADSRRRITRIEVVRIRPQSYQDEPVRELIDDPWKIIRCPAETSGCVAEFEDAQFVSAGRQALYYVRAIQEPTPAINAGGVRCTFDEQGRCIEAHPCYGDYRTAPDDDCLALNEERAWSSPIYVTPASAKR
jgi:hypothetical protein